MSANERRFGANKQSYQNVSRETFLSGSVAEPYKASYVRRALDK
jgi:hypothetical protein